MILRLIFIFCLLHFLTFCKHSLDRNTKETAEAVGQLTGAFLLKAGDAWASYEKSDGDFEWKDIVADLWISLRKDKLFTYKEQNLIEKEVNNSLKKLRKSLK